MKGISKAEEKALNISFVGPKRYHNIIIDPGMTAFDGANPGFSVLQLDLNSQVFYDLKQYFLAIEYTYNWTAPFPPIAQWPWVELNYTKEVGLGKITPDEIALLN